MIDVPIAIVSEPLLARVAKAHVWVRVEYAGVSYVIIAPNYWDLMNLLHNLGFVRIIAHGESGDYDYKRAMEVLGRRGCHDVDEFYQDNDEEPSKT